MFEYTGTFISCRFVSKTLVKLEFLMYLIFKLHYLHWSSNFDLRTLLLSANLDGAIGFNVFDTTDFL